MRMTWLIILGMMIAPSLARGGPLAGAQATRPSVIVPAKDCVTSECHPAVKQFAVVHGPVSSNSCDACHEQVDIQQHKFIIRRDKADLCTYCHQFSVAGMPVVHKPVAEGQCLGCHDPHGGATHALVREASTRELCARCHEAVLKDKSFAHGPVKQGECSTCHPPHAARFAGLVDLAGADLCLACHAELQPRLASAKFVHKAMKEGCQKCHDVHGSNIAMSLRSPPPELCLGCHETTRDSIAAATVGHSVVMQDRACLTCHDSHAADLPALATETAATTCLKCHDRPVKAADGRTIAAVPEIADPNLHKHGELREGKCGSCHAVHGGSRQLLLKKDYSRVFYQKFAAENFELCFDCHDIRQVRDERTTTATGFRDGDVNLHFIHANRGDRDKNCRACHLMHAAPNDRLIRSSLEYGIWSMPIGFARTSTGGACAPGCHQAYAYDRARPVNAVPPAATRPSHAAARRDGDQLVRWTTTDLAGQPLTIPDGKGPTVLLLARGGSGLAGIIQSVGAAIPPEKHTQTVLVICGEMPAEELAALRGSIARNWRIVVDDRNDAAAALGIRGWPTLLILDPDGLERARFAAEPGLLALRLGPYVEAAGRKDQTPRDHRIATHPADDSGKRFERELAKIRRSLSAGEPRAALDAIDRLPAPARASGDVSLLRAEALLRLDRPIDALAELNAHAPPVQWRCRHAILRSRVAIALRDWGFARQILERAIADDPDSAEAHHALGEVYEQLGEWRAAAEQYKAASELSRRR